MNYIDEGIDIVLGALELERADLSERQQNNVREFVLISMECDEEMLDGIDHQIPMTYELYSRTIAKLEELGARRTLEDFRACFAERFSN